ncbi:hypothetical protein PI125_g19622 [Phytophthora idaei]|nr:hypothetical protein PI125_g19622 [Phytophthora idaei]
MTRPLVQPQQSLPYAQRVLASSQAAVQSSVQYGPHIASQPQSQLAPQAHAPQQAPAQQQVPYVQPQPILPQVQYSVPA